MVKIIIVLLMLLSNIPLLFINTTAKADNTQCRDLPVLMYHSMLNSKKGRYIVSQNQFEDDLKCFLDKGYTTVFPSEIIAFVNGTGTLPEKPLLITFDDGFYNNMVYALPILKKYNAKANINVVGSFTENSITSGEHSKANYSHLTWNQIKQLVESGCFEIGNHTYNMHKSSPRLGISKLSSETEEQYTENLTKDITKLQDILTTEVGVTPNVFAYPFGKINPTAKEVLKSLGFVMMLSCYEGNNVIRKNDYNCLLELNRYNRDGNYSTEAYVNKVIKV